ncbi:MAG: 3-carboxy-cis,cis-muconate cycloisomerase [Thermoleophilaceae bacterium]|nr:3-carboxy-cis,cis-muconate cycloisomerase [Thermoleophilaceae bacterium]
MPFDAIFVPDAMRAAVDDRAWLQAMLDAEAALARAQARAGVIPEDAAAAIADACRAERFDVEAIAQAARAAGNPVPALVAAVEGDAARWFHWGATSQDILDTAAMLVARHALELIAAELDGVADACAGLAEAHRETIMPARTLMQQALPTTFGLKAACWLDAVLDARDELRRARLSAQLGGAAGTLASMGDAGPAVLREFARELGLEEPAVPWHASRARVAALGAGLAIAAGSLAKIALDVLLLAQTEVGEVASGTGGSSAMPHKRNPVEAIRARACARQVGAAAALLVGSVGEHEGERAAGAWHAEWAPLSDALALTGGAAAAVREMLEGLEVLTDRMASNVATVSMAEHVVLLLAERVGRPEAKLLVEAAAKRAAEGGRTFREELLEDPLLEADEVDRALDPAGYLGSANLFVDRALARHRA